MLTRFWLQKRSKMPPQNDQKTIKKTSRKNNIKKNEKRPQSDKKNPKMPKPAPENLTVPPPCTPLQGPLRGMTRNSQPLLASSKPLSVKSRHAG